ncbi:hypothetical protein KP509_24G058500 [Ceratopteris richardii]|nr:hypothetical protein KP509_24G058500 [Ceratopteris richardii]
MGLETMPSPEPFRRQRRPLESQNPNIFRTPDKMCYFASSAVPSIKHRREGVDDSRDCSIRSISTRKNLLLDLSRKYENADVNIHKEHTQNKLCSPIVRSGNPLNMQVRGHFKSSVDARPVSVVSTGDVTQRNIQDEKVAGHKASEPRKLNVGCLSSQTNTADEARSRKGKALVSSHILTNSALKPKAEKNKGDSASTSTDNSNRKLLTRPESYIKPVKNCQSSQEYPKFVRSDVKMKKNFEKKEQINKQLNQREGGKHGSRLSKDKAKMNSCNWDNFQSGRSLSAHSSDANIQDALSTCSSLIRPANVDNARNSSAHETAPTIQHISSSCSTNTANHRRQSHSSKDSSMKCQPKIKAQKTGARVNRACCVSSAKMASGTVQTTAEVVPLYESAESLQHSRNRHQPLDRDNIAQVDSSLTSLDDRFSADESLGARIHDEDENLESSFTAGNNFLHDRNHVQPSLQCDDKYDTGTIPKTCAQEESEILGSSVTFESDILHDRFQYLTSLSCTQLEDEDVPRSLLLSRTASFRSTSQGSLCDEAVSSSSNVLNGSANRCQNICPFSLEDVGDTACSNDIESQKQTVSYSGKSTATILKELLLALKPSTKAVRPDEASSMEDSCMNCSTVDCKKKCTQQYSFLTYSADGDFHPNNIQAPLVRVCDVKHTLRECNDICWQDTTPRTSNMKEGEPYEGDNSRCLVKNLCYRGMGTRNNHWLQATVSEEYYIRHVLSSANVCPGTVMSARLLCSDNLIEPGLFDEIEDSSCHQWQWGVKNEHEADNHACDSEKESNGCLYATAARINRKLVFECIREALMLDMGISEQESMHIDLPAIDAPSYNLCSQHVHRQINIWKGMACGLNVDDVIEKDMNSGTGRWQAFPCEFYSICKEIETEILKELIDELLYEFNHQILGNRKCQVPIKARKEKYLWK